MVHGNDRESTRTLTQPIRHAQRRSHNSRNIQFFRDCDRQCKDFGYLHLPVTSQSGFEHHNQVALAEWSFECSLLSDHFRDWGHRAVHLGRQFRFATIRAQPRSVQRYARRCACIERKFYFRGSGERQHFSRCNTAILVERHRVGAEDYNGLAASRGNGGSSIFTNSGCRWRCVSIHMDPLRRGSAGGSEPQRGRGDQRNSINGWRLQLQSTGHG